MTRPGKLRPLACVLALGALLGGIAAGAPTASALEVGGDPRVDPDAFRITVFASGLDFPMAMAELSDRSLLVGVSHPDGTPGAIWFDTLSELVRFEDADGDGVADGPGSPLFTALTGLVTAVRLAGDLVVVATQDSSVTRLSILRRGVTPTDPFTPLGSLDFSFPIAWGHQSLEVEARPSPDQADQLEVLVVIGSDEDTVASTRTVAYSGLSSGSLAGDAIHLFTFDDSQAPLTVASVSQVVSGVRNPFGLAFSSDGAELFFADNGYRSGGGVILMSDELNRLASMEIGGPIEDFGFPDTYVDYTSGAVVGSGGILPLTAFRPLPGGAESIGPAKVALAPPLFPLSLRHGIFVGFHGQFSSNPGDNDWNPVVWVDAASGETFHFVSNDQPSIGHPDGLLATSDSLFIADFTDVIGFSGFGTGALYQIRALPPEVPATGALSLGVLGLALLVGAALGRRWVRASREAGFRA